MSDSPYDLASGGPDGLELRPRPRTTRLNRNALLVGALLMGAVLVAAAVTLVENRNPIEAPDSTTVASDRNADAFWRSQPDGVPLPDVSAGPNEVGVPPPGDPAVVPVASGGIDEEERQRLARARRALDAAPIVAGFRGQAIPASLSGTPGGAGRSQPHPPMLGALARYRLGKSARRIGAELAWINCWPQPDRLRSYAEFDLYWKGAYQEAERAGYRLEEFRCPSELSTDRLQQILLARSIRGILLAPAWSIVKPDWGRFDWDAFSVVRFGYSLDEPRAHLVTSDQVQDGLLAYESMWNRGYRRIGMVMWAAQGTRTVRFSAGYLYAQLRTGSRTHMAPLSLDEDRHVAQVQLEQWLKQAKPDAILTDIGSCVTCFTRRRFGFPATLAWRRSACWTGTQRLASTRTRGKLDAPLCRR